MGIRDHHYRVVPMGELWWRVTAPPVPTFWRGTQSENTVRT